ncbi:hypothetical protein MSG28_009820 [Choristoneura fumiferana]|uniref:Uncharacterized protein n=2 Tax=Choristoneura fumiferana TaxID=7141 RepID=A0ACC0JCY1_CHOFU|nr:hypothetical protein MSG28_009820 [Choristoneura fumiferana]
MIRLAPSLFRAPAQLVTDAAAYLSARESRQHLDESISDKTAANTVYTFVDRGRTAAENSSNPTDTALAQLYAHIQALPESTHKRRLIKHFNRQNGYGTPIQIQRTGKVAGSRSFGDSIKRHIFNKGLLNKTPKKGSGSAINSVEEKCKKRLDDKNDVLHKNIVLKNLAHKIASSESLDDDDYESDASNESTLSEGAISRRRKQSPKFVSEPNLSMIDAAETPKNTKKGSRLFRSKLLSASQNINKKYQKRHTVIRATPTSCVSCFDEQDTGSDNDLSHDSPIQETPKKRPMRDEDFQINYLTSTPGIPETPIVEDCATPYTMNFRRASMSPITKSTQKLSKAMQESIMTPRSRKPLIITCEQRDLPEQKASVEADAYQSMSLKNDSDFVSSDDETRSTASCDRSAKTSLPRSRTFEGRSLSAGDVSPLRSENTRFILSHERPNLIEQDLNTTLCDVIPKITENLILERTRSLSEPFREYLLSRSVLTATPVDLSILNNSKETEDISESLLYCLDGNMPCDLTSSIGNLAVDSVSLRSPLRNVNVDSPSRKRGAGSLIKDEESGAKKSMVQKENVCKPVTVYEIRETDL